MKKIINISFLLVAIFLFSCTVQEKDIFNDSPANRIEAALKADQAILTGAKNGWLMEYYPAAQQIYGGFNVLVSFTDDKATVASEIALPSKSSTSYYSLKQSAGPVLTFDSYNDIFHVFSTPDSKIAGVGKNGVGYGGDFEFLILKATADSVILQGKKTSNRIVMTPLTSETSWSDQITKLQEAKYKMLFSKFTYEVNNKSIPVSVNNRTLVFKYTNEQGSQVTVSVPYIQTLTGYKLYSPLTIEGVTVNEFIFKQEGDVEYFVPSNGANAKLVVLYPPINQQLVSGNWYFKYSGLGSYGKTKWDYTKTNGLDKIGEELNNAYIGTYSTGAYGFCFASSDGTGLYAGVFICTYTLVNEDKITYTYSQTVLDNALWYFNNAAFGNLINPISNGKTNPRTFTITADNVKKPTWIKLTEDANANNTMILEKTPVYSPYSK